MQLCDMGCYPAFALQSLTLTLSFDDSNDKEMQITSCQVEESFSVDILVVMQIYMSLTNVKKPLKHQRHIWLDLICVLFALWHL